MRVALVNSVILNAGDAGIVYGTCDAITDVYPSAHIRVFAHQTGAARRYYADLDLQPMPFDTWPRSRIVRAGLRETFSFRHALNARTRGESRFLDDVANSHAIVYCGGGYINDNYSTKLLFEVIEATLQTGIPHMAYAHSIGPIVHPETAGKTRRLLSRFRAVTVRDEASLELLAKLDVSGPRVALLADAALAMQPQRSDTISEPDRVAMEHIQRFKEASGAPLIFLSVRRWRFPGHPDGERLSRHLLQQLSRLTAGILSATDCNICFVSTCQGRPEYIYDDSILARHIVDGLGGTASERVMVCGHGFAPRAYPYLIRRCADLVVSMRMHMTIFSVLAGVPFVAIAYERKSVELCRRLDLQRYCHDAAEFDADAAIESVLDLYRSRESQGAALRRSGEILVELSKRNAAVLIEECVRRSAHTR